MNFGDLALKLAFVSGLAAAAGFARFLRTDKGSRLADRLFAAHAALLIAAFAVLAALFMGHRFEYAYVNEYSSRALSPALTLAALWAGQQGSILLWTMLGALLGVALMLQPGRLARPAMFFLTLAQLGMTGLVLIRSPFVRLAVAPADGQGLNPLLEDPWMVAHPPALFVGYAAMLVPFALAAAALIRGEHRDWPRMVWPWALFAVVSLGIGIVLGGIWAYRTLGWGGYWGWDPVENASLVPWLIAVALLHGLMIQRARGALGRTNLLLALLGWSAVVGGTYLTRSGVLENFSVHSFADSGLSLPLALFLGGTFALGAGLLIWRWGSVPAAASNWISMSRESALWLGLMTVLGFAVLVTVGTAAPLLTAMAGRPAGLQTSFYQAVAMPFGLAILVLMALAPALRWVRQQGLSWMSLLPPGLVVGAVTMVTAVLAGLRDVGYLLLLFATGAALGVNAWMAAKLFRRGWRFGAGYLGHAGIAVMVIGIAVSTSLGKSERLRLQEGVAVQSLGYSLEYAGRETDAHGAQYLNLRVTGRNLDFRARPRLMESPRGDGMIRTPAIHGWRELYISPLVVNTIARSPTGSVTWLQKGREVVVDDVGYRFVGFRMEGGEPLMVHADMQVRKGAVIASVSPALAASSGGASAVPAEVAGVGPITIARIDADRGRVAIATPSGSSSQATVATIDFSRKPLVNLVWIGGVIMLLGSGLAGLRRAGEQRPATS